MLTMSMVVMTTVTAPMAVIVAVTLLMYNLAFFPVDKPIDNVGDYLFDVAVLSTVIVATATRSIVGLFVVIVVTMVMAMFLVIVLFVVMMMMTVVAAMMMTRTVRMLTLALVVALALSVRVVFALVLALVGVLRLVKLLDLDVDEKGRLGRG